MKDTVSLTHTPTLQSENVASAAATATVDEKSSPSTASIDLSLIACLAPMNLPLARTRRAWEQHARSPFYRRNVRFGKIWKRNVDVSPPLPTPADRRFVNLNTMVEGVPESPSKVVKKLRVGDQGQAVACNWDGRGSPSRRRTVTWSTSGGQTLRPSELEGHGTNESSFREEVFRIEVVYEDGTTEEVDVEEAMQQENWEDESITEEDPEGWDRLAALEALKQEQDASDRTAFFAQTDGSSSPSEYSPRNENHKLDSYARNQAASQAATSSDTDQSSAIDQARLTILPEGFVSPRKADPRRSPSQARKAFAERRRTLPAEFPAYQQPPIDGNLHTFGRTPNQTLAGHVDVTSAKTNLPEPSTIDTQYIASERDKNCSELDKFVMSSRLGFVESEAVGQDESHTKHYPDVTLKTGTTIVMIPNVENAPSSTPAVSVEGNSTVTRLADKHLMATPSNFSPSPAMTISAQHPRKVLKSPRRQSSSPLQRDIAQTPYEKPHFVAWTPMKLTSSVSTIDNPMRLQHVPEPSRITDENNSASGAACQQLLQYFSAVPEDELVKTKCPRLSDDTAVLRAFLDRAAEERIGKTSSSEDQDPSGGSRHSGRVGQALSGKAKENLADPDVLTDLDPNSMSPRRISAQSDSYDGEHKECLKGEDGEATLVSPLPNTQVFRRSGRAKNKAETLPTTCFSGPTKISVRGTADAVVLKKSEAHQLAQVTRANTRKNKGSAVLPPLRLLKLANDAKDYVHVENEESRQAKIRWSEALVSFSENAPESWEGSVPADALGGSGPLFETNKEQSDSDSHVSLIPPPIETPSKPKLRRLKPPKTGSSDPNSCTQVEHRIATMQQAAEPRTKSSFCTKKRSGLAAPTKPRVYDPAFALPENSTFDQQTLSIKPTIATRKLPVSKLPTPTSISIDSDQDQETPLVASSPIGKSKSTSIPAYPALISAKPSVPKLTFTSPAICPPATALNSNGRSFLAPSMSRPARKTTRANNGLCADSISTSSRAPPAMSPNLASPAKKRARKVIK